MGPSGRACGRLAMLMSLWSATWIAAACAGVKCGCWAYAGLAYKAANSKKRAIPFIGLPPSYGASPRCRAYSMPGTGVKRALLLVVLGRGAGRLLGSRLRLVVIDQRGLTRLVLRDRVVRDAAERALRHASLDGRDVGFLPEFRDLHALSLLLTMRSSAGSMSASISTSHGMTSVASVRSPTSALKPTATVSMGLPSSVTVPVPSCCTCTFSLWLMRSPPRVRTRCGSWRC